MGLLILSVALSPVAASADQNISIDMDLLDANTSAVHSCITHSPLLPFTNSHLGVKSGSDPTRPMSRLHAWQTGASGAISRDMAIEHADSFFHCCGLVNLVSLPFHSSHCSRDFKLLSELENDNFLLLLIIN